MDAGLAVKSRKADESAASERPAKSLWRRLGSPRFAQVLLAAWLGLVLALLVPMQFIDAGEPVRHLAYNPIVVLSLYVPLAAATVACMVQRFGVLRRKLPVQGRPKTVRPGEGIQVGGEFERDRAVRVLRKAGFRRIEADDTAAWGVVRPLGPLGNVVLHAGLVLLVIGGAMSAVPGGTFVGRARLIEGESFRGDRSQYFEIGHGETPNPLAPVPPVRLASASGDAAVGRPATEMSASLKRADSEIAMDAATPWLATPISLIALEDVDLAATVSITPSATPGPALRATTRDGLRALFNPAVLKIAVPQEGLYRVNLRVPKTEPATAPRSLLVSVARADGAGFRLLAEERPVPIGGLIRIGGTTVRLDGVRPAAVLRVTQSPSLPIVTLGVLLATLGPLMRLFAPRREAIVRAVGDGVVVVTRADAYRTSLAATRRLAATWESIR